MPGIFLDRLNNREGRSLETHPLPKVPSTSVYQTLNSVLLHLPWIAQSIAIAEALYKHRLIDWMIECHRHFLGFNMFSGNKSVTFDSFATFRRWSLFRDCLTLEEKKHSPRIWAVSCRRQEMTQQVLDTSSFGSIPWHWWLSCSGLPRPILKIIGF